MSDRTDARAVDVISEAERVVRDLCAEYGCVTGGTWQQLAERAYLEGRIAGLEWAHRKMES